MGFGEIIGHSRQIKILKSALKSGRIPHAYLFEGPEGIGKRLAAQALAEAMLCEAKGDDACGTCGPCRKVRDRTHSDVWWIEPEKNAIRIDLIRQLQKDLNFDALEGKGRVIIVDEADKMLHSAANALLKTLEEPPPSTTIVLITSRPQMLLPTIASRCQRLAFGPLTAEKALQVIAARMDEDPGVAELLALLSGGSPGRALAFDRDLFLEERPRFIESVEKCTLQNIKKIFQLSEKLDKRRSDVLIMLEILQCWYRDLAVYKVTRDPELIINVDLLPKIQKAAEQGDMKMLISSFDTIGETFQNLDRNANVRLSLDTMLLRLSREKRSSYFNQ